MPSVVIVGAGVGGLTAGIGLRRAGWDVTVYERAPAIGVTGTGISLWANAFLALDDIGVGERMRGNGVVLDEITILDTGGRPILTRFADAGLARDERGPHEPARLLKRAALLYTLLDELGEDVVRYDMAAETVRNTGSEVVVTFGDGTSARADLVLGADGIRSSIRSAAFPDAPAPRDINLVAARGSVARARVVDLPDTEVSTETWGEDAYFGIVPLTADRIYWYANARELTPEGLGRRFSGFHHPIPAIIDATLASDEDVLFHPIEVLPRLDRWTAGRVALLGDAAHAMTPLLGQGACQAIEDGVALVRVLASATAVRVPERLVLYEQVRKPRAELVQARSASFCELILRGGFRAQLRNLLLRRGQDPRFLLKPPNIHDPALPPIPIS